jgi:hypothetical protein
MMMPPEMHSVMTTDDRHCARRVAPQDLHSPERLDLVVKRTDLGTIHRLRTRQ